MTRQSFFFTLIVFLSCTGLLPGQSAGNPPHPTTNDQYDSIDVNNIRMWLNNNGNMSYNERMSGNGFEWPKNSGKTLVFEDGLIFGGMVDGNLHVGGSTYRQGLQAGPILSGGQASDPNDPRNRVYKIRLVSAAEYTALPPAAQARLRKDFNEWPAADGAPYIDTDRNGFYNPDFDKWLADSLSSDKPWFVGDEVVWFASNDMDTVRVRGLYGTKPAAFEIHSLIWEYNRCPELMNVVFVKHTLINKNNKPMTD